MLFNFNFLTIFNIWAIPELKSADVPELKSAVVPDYEVLSKCISLHETTQILFSLYDYNDGGFTYEYSDFDSDSDDSCLKGPKTEILREQVFNRLFSFVNREMNPTFDDIDDMLLVCRILIEYKKRDEITEFILKCPERFLITYANNSERTPQVLYKLEKLKLYNIKKYLIGFINETKLMTWNERYNKTMDNI